MTLNPFRTGFRGAFLAGFVACVAILGYAIYLQLHDGLEPCPLCIFQRIAFAALAVVFLLGALHAPAGAGGRRAYGVLAGLAALTGAGIAGRHVWLHLNPPAMPSCGPGLDYLRETLSATNLVRRVLQGSGDCGLIDWTFLGISMPGWSLVCFLVLGAWALRAAWRRSPARG